jgi:hypothetical protein
VVAKDVQHVRPETALLIALVAAVVGQVLGGLLTLFGGWVNDHFASKRLERQQKREDSNRNAQQEREDQLRMRDARLRAYKALVTATTIERPVENGHKPDRHRALNEAYIEAKFYADGLMQNYIDPLYKAAWHAIDLETTGDPVWSRLEEERDEFIQAVRTELNRESKR